jgi:GNAT superfamily N-acetyltransferase
VADDELLHRAYEGNRRFVRAVGAGEGARMIEPPGVSAALIAQCPERAIVNSVAYDGPGSLAPHLQALATAYDEAGVDAWTVWVPRPDRATARLLEEAGHVLDSTPPAMVADLADIADPEPGPAEWEEAPTPEVVGPMNDLAYGFDGSFTRALTGVPPGEFQTWVARVDGTPASCLMTIDNDEDCHVVLVATLAEHRGRGLATGLLAHALAAARGRGLKTTSLLASPMGAPVYERMGYRPVGVVEMWERRREPGA